MERRRRVGESSADANGYGNGELSRAVSPRTKGEMSESEMRDEIAPVGLLGTGLGTATTTAPEIQGLDDTERRGGNLVIR